MWLARSRGWGRLVKVCNALQEHRYWTLSVAQRSSEFSVHPYLGPADLDGVSALSTQMILMQAVFQHASRNSDLQVFCLFVCFLAVPHGACGVLVSRPGIESVPPAMEARSPNHWTAREFPGLNRFNRHLVASDMRKTVTMAITTKVPFL